MMAYLLGCQLPPLSNNQSSIETAVVDTASSDLPLFMLKETLSSVVHTEYVMDTWRLTTEHQEEYESLFEEEQPTFYTLRPDPLPLQAPIMWWFHGSAFGLDIDETPRGCQADTVIPAAKRVVTSENMAAALLAQKGWIIVAPRNDWCDMWQGEGTDDLADPNHHFGGHHLSEVIQFVRSGGLGITPSKEALWGTSMGGHGAMRAQLYHGPFSSLIMDSSPSSALLFYALDYGPNDPAALEHIFGGPPYLSNGSPSPFFDAYQSASAEVLLELGHFNLPVFGHFNTLDTVTPVNHAHALREAIVNYGELGSGIHDHNHPYPGQDSHVQTLGGPNLEQGYIASAMVHFSEGQQVHWTEAETPCPACTAGEIITASSNSDLKGLSGAAGRLLSLSDTGIFWAQPLHSQIHHIQPMLSRISTSEPIQIQFFEDETLLETKLLPPTLFQGNGLETVRSAILESYIPVPVTTNRMSIQLSPNSSAILDGVLTFQER